MELMSLEESREKVLRRALAPVREDYDYIFIDCPPSLNVFSVNALTAADSVLIPMPGDFFSLEGIAQLMNTVKLVKKHLNHALEIEGVVMTMYDGRSNLSNQVAQEVLKWFGKSVFKTRIPRNVTLGEAPSYGLPLCSIIRRARDLWHTWILPSNCCGVTAKKPRRSPISRLISSNNPSRPRRKRADERVTVRQRRRNRRGK